MNQHPDKTQSCLNRPVRSYVLRTGRLTQAQQSAIDTLWPKYGLDIAPDTSLTQHTCFNRQSRLVLEIGFGMGDSLAKMARNEPETDFIGIEVHTPGLGNLLKLIEQEQINNLKIINHDASEVLKQHIAKQSLDQVNIYFPDPWPKKRHHKRRIIQPELIALLATLLKPAGIIHIATDWEAYAEHIAEVMSQANGFESLAEDKTAFSPRPDYRPLTKFEQRGLRLGHGVWDVIYQKTA